jgi:hypothetical protein
MIKPYLFLVLCFLSAVVNADAYRCKATNGQAVISTSPCTDNQSVTRVISDTNANEEALHRAQADLERQKRWLRSRESEQRQLAPQHAIAPASRPVSGDANDPVGRDRIHACLMQVTAIFGLSPSQEASRKVSCYRGTSGLRDECEGRVTATMRLSTQEEGYYRAQCKSL